MKKQVKVEVQNVGVDISKDSFYAAFVVQLEERVVKIKGTRSFPNTSKGIKSFIQWADKIRDFDLNLHITMEATGTYYEDLAYTLYEKKDVIVHVLLPNIAKKYFESLNIKTKTDKVDAKILGQMGVERKLRPWVLSSKIYRDLRTLSREREQLTKEQTRVKNQLHALVHSADPYKRTMQRLKKRITYLEKQIKTVVKDLEKLVATDEYVSQKIKKIITTPGLGFKTVVGVVAETSGFNNFTGLKQLTSYGGYDVVIKESGKWKGKTSISKKGNSHIRHLMYMPALSAVNNNALFKNTYDRIKEKKEHHKIASVAIQRKLLGLIFTLWKTDSIFIHDYENKKQKQQCAV